MEGEEAKKTRDVEPRRSVEAVEGGNLKNWGFKGFRISDIMRGEFKGVWQEWPRQTRSAYFVKLSKEK